ncbi:hypothetical protein J2X69_004848 [Algoriphagus sp. 4150]|nr:hypothetical protein [Algoriphagus sp. 4150]
MIILNGSSSHISLVLLARRPMPRHSGLAEVGSMLVLTKSYNALVSSYWPKIGYTKSNNSRELMN